MRLGLITNIIYNVIENRIYKFTFEEIAEEIKNKIIDLKVFNGSKFINSNYFEETILKAINYYVDYGEIVKIGDYYFPGDTYLYRDYNVNSDVLTYSYGYNKNDSLNREIIFWIENCCDDDRLIDSNDGNIILVGELLQDNGWDVSEVSFEEINNLYYKLKSQGADRSEIVQYILNYYNAFCIDGERFPNRYSISSHVKKLNKNNC